MPSSPHINLSEKPFSLSGPQLEWVETTFNALDIPEKVGQIICHQTYLPIKRDLNDILKYKPGAAFLGMGILAFKKRQQNAARHLQEKSEIPLLIAGDIEGGGFGAALNATRFSTQMGVGATNDEKYAYYMGKVAGTEGRILGFNWTFSPVVDINYNHRNPVTNVRAFSDDPEKVLRMSLAYVKGVQECGMAATAKHWPGDGMDDRDQHLVTSCNSMDFDEWKATYGKIYKVLIDAGVMSVMSAHIMLPSYTGDYLPGSYSSKLNQDLLRGELGFNGLIVSDATGMVGVTSQAERREMVPTMIERGCDVFLFTHGRAGDYQKMLEGVETGLLSKKRLDDAVRRVLGLKAALKLPELKEKGKLVPPKEKRDIVNGTEHKKWARECARHSITLVKDTQGLLPISPEKQKRVLLITSEDMMGLPIAIFSKKFPKILKARGFNVTKYKKKVKISKHKFDLVMYLIIEPGYMAKNCLRLNWKKLPSPHPGHPPTIFISLANPYHLYEVPRVKTYINAYAPFKAIQEELVRMLVGEIPFKGVNPVDTFCDLPESRL